MALTKPVVDIGTDLWAGNTAANVGTIIMDAGGVDVSRDLIIGNNGTGTFTLDGGLIKVGTDLKMDNGTGVGTLTINGGVMDVGRHIANNTDGTIILNGGKLKNDNPIGAVWNYNLGVNGGATDRGHIYIHGGTLEVTGDNHVTDLVNIYSHVTVTGGTFNLEAQVLVRLQHHRGRRPGFDLHAHLLRHDRR